MKDNANSFQYYALDVEWSEKEGIIQPLEIGVTPVSKHGETIFSYIRPSDEEKLRNTIFKFLRVKKKALMEAPDYTSVIQVISRRVNRVKGKLTVAVVWAKDSRDNFIRWCRKYDVRNPFYRIIVLKEIVLRVQDRREMKNDFEHLLMEYDVKYKPGNLNNSKYDAIYLNGLFMEIKKKYDQSRPWNWLVLNTESGIVHRQDCSRINIKCDRYRKFEVEDLYTGSRFCKICGRDIRPWVDGPSEEKRKLIDIKDYSRRIPVNEQFMDASVAAMCINFGFDYSIYADFIEVESCIGKWRIYHNDKEVTKVYHGNHFGKMAMKGFHEQRIGEKDLFSVLKYINSHDLSICSKNKSKLIDNGTGKKKEAKSRKIAHKGSRRNYYLKKDEWEDYYD